VTVADPFAAAPEFDEAQAAPEPVDESPFEEPPVEAPKKAPAKKVAAKPAKKENTLSESKITITLKGGSGFDAPWIVIHADDLEDASRQVNDEAALLADVMERVQKAGQHFAGLGPSKPASSSGGAPARPGAEAPGGTPAAPGPDWTYKTGVGKNGKTWKAWMPPRGSDASPVWL